MTTAELIALVSAAAGLLTPLGVIATAIGVIVTIRGQQKLRAEVKVVKEQNDGLISRMEIARDASQAEAKTATAATAVAEAATIAATAAGVAGVMEANRTHEASSAAIEKGARDAVEPIAEEAVAKGAKAAVAEAKREESAGKK